MHSMIDDLLNPALLPDKTERVSIIQTHISLVFLADEFVYKIKKPVNFGFLDFSTLRKRRYYCHQEIILNRRLSKGVYVGVLPIVYDGKNYRMGIGEGRTVEYAVKMKRLPEEMLMKSVFLRGELKGQHLEKIAKVLATFHLSARNSPDIDKYGEPEMFKVNTDENFAQTERYIGMTVQGKDFEALKRWTADFYNSNRELFSRRIEAKKIRDCHGDLHMEHICLTEDLPIFDCIEFNNRFRYTDTVADIAFLMMDLEYHRGDAFSKILWDFYEEMADEAGVDSLLTFYKVYRAFVRGKVSSFQLDDENIGIEKKQEAIQASRKYFRLARSYIG
ncbi:MAG: gluconokinase [Deltaproteobacteria bacterium]|nr:MAG: gluconokinase [Deltaproteobacteria bacterium]